MQTGELLSTAAYPAGPRVVHLMVPTFRYMHWTCKPHSGPTETSAHCLRKQPTDACCSIRTYIGCKRCLPWFMPQHIQLLCNPRWTSICLGSPQSAQYISTSTQPINKPVLVLSQTPLPSLSAMQRHVYNYSGCHAAHTQHLHTLRVRHRVSLCTSNMLLCNRTS